MYSAEPSGRPHHQARLKNQRIARQDLFPIQLTSLPVIAEQYDPDIVGDIPAQPHIGQRETRQAVDVRASHMGSQNTKLSPRARRVTYSNNT